MMDSNQRNNDPDYIEMQQERKAAAERKAAEDEIYNKGLVKQRLEGVPQWMDAYNAFKKNDPNFMNMQRANGYNDIDRRWNSDEGTKTLKTNLDGDYKRLLDAYNKAHGTDYQADARQIGIDSQPNDWDHTTHDSGGWLNKQVNSVGQFLEDPSKAVSNLGGEISKSKLAQTVISMAAAAYGVPPNVTMALLSANNIGQGQDPMEVAKGIAMSYIGNAAGDFAGGAAKGALAGSGMGDNITSGLTNLASGAAKQLATTGKINAQGLLTSAAGDIIKGSDTYKGLSSGVSTAFKDAGLDSINIGGVDIPGSIDLKGNLIPGVSAADATKLLSQSGSAGRKIAGVANVLRKPTLTGIASLTQPGATAPPRRPPAAVLSAFKAPVTTAAKQPPAAVLAALNKPPTGG